MPSKYQVITEMEAEHLRTLTVDTNHYMDFLTTAANNFKYSFQEQLLIFAQKPDATACAEVSWWNKHGRWVNRNTKGIALLVDTDAPYKLRHVFDVSDTNSRAGKEVPIWKMEQRFVEPVKKVLAERYEVDTHESLEDCLLNVAVTFVNDNYQDYLAELMEAKAGSLLEKLDEDNTRLQMLTALSYSVGYMLHIRSGLPGRAYFGNSLDKVCNFNTPEVISILGAAVSDMKSRYLDEITGGRGTVFATGTPISNSMVEMYTMQKYLQYGTLKEKNLLHFDAWASTFGETVTAIELAPEGTGYRAKTRFVRFYNLPELMSMFKQTADIQTADMLKLPVPKANYHNVVLKPSAYQVEMVKDLSERAERVRNRMVDSSVDNMLLITNDGRKLALDQRLMNPMLPDDENGKVSACAKNVFEIWQKTAEQKSTQMVFCDLSTPHNDGNFNVYDGIRDKLLDMGIPKDQIAYIHNAASEAQKKELFGKVRSGEIRVLIGSTQKMGAGTNVQKKLIALHHVDCPWRPSDLQQREGRIIRQGNENPEVEIYTYVTENTFDSYLYQMVEGKQKFIGQVMTSKAPARSAEDIDETALSYAEVKALCTGNPYIKEKMDLDIAVQRLKMLKASHLSQRYALEDKIAKAFPDQIAALEQKISGYKSDIELREAQTMPNEDGFSSMEVEGTAYIEKKAAGSALLAAAHNMTSPDAIPIGMYRGFAMVLSFDTFAKEYRLNLKGQLSHPISLGTDLFGNIQRIDNMLAGLESDLRQCEAQLDNARVQLSNAKAAVDKPFPQEDELKTKLARLDELNILLNLDKRENEIVDGEPDEGEPKEKKREMER